MTADRRGELPPGYNWQELPGINAGLPAPENWHFFGILAPSTEDIKVLGTHLFQISRESIPKRGMFTTGVAIYGFTDFSRNMSGSPEHTASPVDFARRFLRTLPVLHPVGELTEIEDGPLVICKRRFVLPVERFMTIPSFHGELVSKMMPPSHFYYMAAGNRETDTAYLAWFETPSAKWKNDKPIAETMINNLTFDQTI